MPHKYFFIAKPLFAQYHRGMIDCIPSNSFIIYDKAITGKAEVKYNGLKGPAMTYGLQPRSLGARGCAMFMRALLLSLSLVIASSLHAKDEEPYQKLLDTALKVDEGSPTERIYSKGELLYCTGESEAARANNGAADLMAEGNFREASGLLLDALKRAPLFLPFRYNLGICYIYLNQLNTAQLHLTKALYLLPRYSKTHIQLGYIYDRYGKGDIAMDYFKNAIRINPKELNALIYIGDVYYNRKQITMAEKYYDQALLVEPRFPNGLLGKAKIHYYREEYFKAIVQIKSISTAGEYDRSLHYYFAESAFKLRDYKTAFEQYEKLLHYRNDRFFLVNSAGLIKHKMELSRRFVER